MANNGLADPSLLVKIDKLFACGVGDLIDLPQIVVVGDQSSGKSSVLEGLVRKEFPRDSGLCTRFATQIIFRRSAETSIKVSIIPDADVTGDERAALERWGYTIDSLESEQFVRIMKEVHEVLGLKTPGELDDKKPTFSDSVLCLKISGPDQEHLSVIDVPGIFKKSTQGLTKKEDIKKVRDMVQRYMENPRTVMLLVVPANVDPATQEIIEMASDVDPQGDRTLGVLTKPDLVDRGAERDVMNTLNGHTNTLQLGWHAVRNPGQIHLNDPSIDRSSLEIDFFETTAPWNELDPSQVGVEALRTRLNQVLSDLVKREFPKVKAEILRRLQLSERDLAALGPERSTSNAHMAFLTSLSTKFQSYVPKCVGGKFGADLVIDHSPQLATRVSARMKTFSEELSSHGHTYCFSTRSLNEPGEDLDNDLFRRNSTSLKCRKLHKLPAVGDLIHDSPDQITCKDGDIESWLMEVYESSRGFELGTFEPSILASILRAQTINWAPLALYFMSDIITMVHETVTNALKHVCRDKTMQACLLDIITPGLLARYTLAIKHVEFILEVERDGIPLTLNHYFNDNLQKARQKRGMAHFNKVARTDEITGDKVVRLDQAILTQSIGNDEHTVQDIHDILLSYYKVAKKRFIDNVVGQAMAHFLLTGTKTPLNLFSPEYIAEMTEAEREYIAGEAPATKRRRARLTKEVVSLAEARTVLNSA